VKKYAIALCALWAGWTACAQVTVEITQEQQQFLQGEAINVAVRITNRSGQTLKFGETDDWLTLGIESREGLVVGKLEEVPVKGEFDLESMKVATKRANITPYFAPMRPGNYGITATLYVKEWNREITSPVKYFDVIEGAKLWEQEVGVPNDDNSPPEIRKYTLQQANYLKGLIRLYLRVSDTYGKTYRVFPIGPMISFGRPEPQVDKFGHLHVLYQTGPSLFSYTVYDLEGTLLARQAYEYQATRPKLRMDEDGIVFVFGGVRRLTPNDVPPSSEDDLKPVGSTNSVATNVVAKPATNALPQAK
jgi:hypothetical protein